MSEVAGVRHSLGPVEVYAYHDYPTRPAESPLYVGVRLGTWGREAYIGVSSILRPFSGGPEE